MQFKTLISFTIQFFQVGCLSIKNGFNANPLPAQEKPLAIPTTAVVSCLYERNQPVFIDANKLEKSGMNSGALNTQLCKLSDVKLRYSGIPISETLNFSKNPITRTKSHFPWIWFTVILPPIFRTPDFFEPIFVSLGGSRNRVPLYVLISCWVRWTHVYNRMFIVSS